MSIEKKGDTFGIRRCAFTLAEVLVTLGIIGVVSAMTVPSLVQNYQRQSYVTQLHKVYNEMQQAFQQELTESNALNLVEARLTDADSIDAFLKKHFKVVTDCEEESVPCFASEYTSLDGSKKSGIVGNKRLTFDRCVTIASGASICLSSILSEREEILAGGLYIDVNGPKGPNIGGRDMFTMRYYNDGSIDVYTVTPECRTDETKCNDNYGSTPIEKREIRYSQVCVTSANGDDCIGKLLNDNWIMNY